MSNGSAARAFRRLARWVDRVERALLTGMVTAMVAIAALQILLRNVWHTGLPWAEPLLGMGLLWLTMLGALAAAGLGRHLAIDLASALLPRQASAWIGRATSLFAAIVCGLLAWAAGRYVGFQRDMAMGDLLGWPLWKHYMAIPIVFWLIAFRFTIRAVVPAAWLPPKEDDGLPGEGRVPS
jgi:TRAP-type C4-dicarboxylate transport system permease small subunit